jgi:hypothetical protein
MGQLIDSRVTPCILYTEPGNGVTAREAREFILSGHCRHEVVLVPDALCCGPDVFDFVHDCVFLSADHRSGRAGIWHGIKYDEEFRILLFFLVSLLTGSTFFDYHVDGWSIIDSLYFSIMTMSTIGYGDFVPTTTLSKLFTIIFALLSIGTFVALISKIVEIVLQLKKLRRAKRKGASSNHD